MARRRKARPKRPGEIEDAEIIIRWLQTNEVTRCNAMVAEGAEECITHLTMDDHIITHLFGYKRQRPVHHK